MYCKFTEYHVIRNLLQSYIFLYVVEVPLIWRDVGGGVWERELILLELYLETIPKIISKHYHLKTM